MIRIYSSGLYIKILRNGKPYEESKTIYFSNTSVLDKIKLINSNAVHPTSVWRKNRIIHRDNSLPAITYSIGYKEWWKNGECVGSPNRIDRELYT